MNLLLNWALSCHLLVFPPGSTSPKSLVPLCVTSKVLMKPFSSKIVESLLPSALLWIWSLLWWSRYHTTTKRLIFFTLKFHYSLLFPINFNGWECWLGAYIDVHPFSARLPTSILDKISRVCLQMTITVQGRALWLINGPEQVVLEETWAGVQWWISVK